MSQTDSRKRILIVDDDQNIREFLTNLLDSLGFDTIEESNPLSVIRTIKKENPDLLTLDLRMPGASGLQIVNALKRERIKLPIVVLSGYLDQENTRQLIDLGVTHIVSKPFKSAMLAQHIESALQKC